MHRPRTFFLILFVACLSTGVTRRGYAQVYTGSIVGRVTDPSGAVLPGATVTITSNTLLKPETAITSETGAYRFTDLAVGTYTVTFDLSAFQTLVRQGIVLTAGLTATVKFNFLWARNDKTKATRGAGPDRPLETTWRQSGPTNIYKLEDTHIFNPNFVVTGRFAYVKGGFALDYQDPSLRNVQASFDLSSGVYGRSYLGFNTDRPQYAGNAEGDYFLSKFLGGDHEFKFGFQYKKSPIDSFTTYGGDVWSVFDNGQSAEAWFFRPSAIEYQGTYAAGYVEDVYSRHRMTLKLSARYDYQVGRNKPSSIPANLVIPDLMPAIDFPGTSNITAWNTLAPRVGFTYDLTSDGKTAARASYSRYYDLLLLSPQITSTNAAGVSEMDLPWTDLNGDGQVQASEVDTSSVLYTRNFDPANPGAVVSPNFRNADTKPPITDEVIAGISREIRPNFAVGANYIYKRFHRMLWSEWPYSGASGTSGLTGNVYPFVNVPADAWVPVTGEFEGRTLTWYELAPGFEKTGDLITNRPGYHQRYQGIELTADKRLSNRWMMNAGFTFADTREYFDGSGGIFDPTNVTIRDGGLVAPYTTGSGKTRIFLNSRWVFNASSMVELPLGINVSGALNSREGFPFIQTFRTPQRAGGIGRAEVILDPVGETRLDNLWLGSLRVEKVLKIRRTEVRGIVDVFNLLNADTVLQKEQRQNFTTADQIQSILSPRVFRFGVRFTL